MASYLQDLLSSNQLAPHGYCLLWRPGLIWTHVFSDVVIGLSYLAIAAGLVRFVRNRADVAFGWIFWCFAGFILLCGFTHFFSIVTFWLPYYGAEAIIKLFTAIISAITAIALVPLIPKALQLPSPAQLRLANQALEHEMVQRERTEGLLRQSQKLEAVGQLTGGIAHDFNNLLTPIRGALEMARTQAVDPDRVARITDSALAAVDRAAALVKRLLAFARQQNLEPEPVDLGALVDGARDLIARSIGPMTPLEVTTPETPLVAMVDPTELELAILNLCLNARDAMPDGGSIKIDIVEKMGRSSDLPEASEGRFASITVTDTGTGMDAETIQHAIEPFFTTKEVGKGTGLGLSSVHGLVAQLGGGMNVTSSVGQGTSVEMWIPVLAADRADRSGLKPDTVQASDSERTPTARILLVDDEPLVRMATKAMLEMGGHAVVDVASGSAALALLEDGYVPDILVTDQMMPGMRGDVLAAKVIEAYPDMRVLIATGYAGSEVQFPQIGKPYSIDQLLNRVQEVLLPAAT